MVNYLGGKVPENKSSREQNKRSRERIDPGAMASGKMRICGHAD